jgi:hypothetical protein
MTLLTIIRSALPAHFIEKIKCSLQVQAARDSQAKPTGTTPGRITDVRQMRAYSTVTIPTAVAMERFTGPIDVIKQTVQIQGVTGMWKGFGVSLVYRTSFAVSTSRLWASLSRADTYLLPGHVRRQVVMAYRRTRILTVQHQASSCSAECSKSSRARHTSFRRMRQTSWREVWQAISTG